MVVQKLGHCNFIKLQITFQNSFTITQQ